MKRDWVFAASAAALMLIPLVATGPVRAQTAADRNERVYRQSLHNARTIQQRHQIEERHRQDLLRAQNQGIAPAEEAQQPAPQQPAWGVGQAQKKTPHPKFGVGVGTAVGTGKKSGTGPGTPAP